MKSYYSHQKYSELSAQVLAGTVNVDDYFYFRALLILGNRDQFNQSLDRFSTAESDQFSILKSFLSWQAQVYFDRTQPKVIPTFDFSAFEESSFLLAEFDFVEGYSALKSNQFRRALLRFHRAYIEYIQCGMPRQAVVSSYNAWVCCHNLNDNEAAHAWLKIVSDVDVNHGENTESHHLQLRAKSYLAIHQLEFGEAAVHLRKMADYYSQTGRSVDLCDALLSLAFVSCMCTDLKTFEFASNEFKLMLLNQSVPLNARSIFESLSTLHNSDQLSEQMLSKLLKQWHGLKQDPVYVLYLHQALCHFLARQNSFEGLLRVTDQGLAIAKNSNQLSTVFDLKYYRILALVALGAYSTAERELSAYWFVARNQLSTKAQARAQVLAQELANLSGNSAHQRDSNNVSHMLTISVETQTVTIDNVMADLSSQPLLFETIRIIAAHGRSIAVSDLFEKLYKQKFNPLRHTARMSSILQRLREQFEAPILQRNDGVVSFGPNVQLLHQSDIPLVDNCASRRARIINTLDHAQSPVTISELVTRLGAKRRTIQLDLHDLLKEGSIRSEGIRKNRRYFA